MELYCIIHRNARYFSKYLKIKFYNILSHVILMNGPNFLAYRGFPCYFSNIKDVAGYKISLIQKNNIIVYNR